MEKTRTIKIALYSALCLAALISCERENLPIGSSTGNIKARVNSSDISTKSAIVSRELIQTLEMDGDDIVLQEYVSDNLSQPFGEYTPAKGAKVTTGNIATVYGVFGMEAFLDNYTDIDSESGPTLTNDDQYIQEGQVNYNSESVSWNLTDKSHNSVPWLNNIHFTFWSYAPKEHLGTYGYGATGSRSFMTITDYVNPSGADDQKDLLVAYNNRWYNDDNDDNKKEYIDINFRHALADVYFDISSITDIKVKKIEIIGAISKGSCVINGTDLSNSDVTKAFSWTPDTKTTATFEMTKGFGKDETADHFFMIPQTLPEKAQISLTLEKDGVETVRYTSISTTWHAGKYYEYILTYDPSTYEFSIAESDEEKTFRNTDSDSEMVSIPVTSNRINSEGTSDAEWDIVSYTINGVTTDVADNQFTDGGLIVSKNGKNVNVTAQARAAENRGSHEFWAKTTERTYDLDWSPAERSGVTDLSKFDFKTEQATATMTTANCYIIRHAGTYKLPLVYGNAIKDGKINKEAYAPVITSGTGVLTSFINHRGVGITSAFIEENENCTASSCSIIWQDRSEIITLNNTITRENVTVKDENDNDKNVNLAYLTFTIPQDKICQNNAIIAVKDASGNIMWSWHIWTTNDPSLLLDPIAVSNHSNVKYDFFPLNTLGWTDNILYRERSQVKVVLKQKVTGTTIDVLVNQPKVTTLGESVYYQFGRKDPMPGRNGVSGFSIQTGPVALKDGILNPGYFYKITGHWFTAPIYHNLWTGKSINRAAQEQSSDLIKTIYDPSPVGYKLPASNAFTGFTTTGDEVTTADKRNVNGDYNQGWDFYTDGAKSSTIHFAATGWRTNVAGVIDLVDVCGYCWSAVVYPGDDPNGYSLDFNNTGRISPLHKNGRADGFPVRPVVE